jgi:hypothetical protein
VFNKFEEGDKDTSADLFDLFYSSFKDYYMTNFIKDSKLSSYIYYELFILFIGKFESKEFYYFLGYNLENGKLSGMVSLFLLNALTSGFIGLFSDCYCYFCFCYYFSFD